MTLSLELYRSTSRYLAAKAVGGRLPGALAGPVAPLRLVNRDEPRLPGPGWARVRPRLAGICGSDLATLSGQSSFYFSPLVSMPFVPGHEVVGELLEDLDGLAAGTRVVLDPVLSCGPRGVGPCSSCAAGEQGRCDRVTVGHVAPGLQTGYCADTGGGWSRRLVAHREQLHRVPDSLSDERAVLVEPLACAVHAVRRARIGAGDAVLVVGAGTVGLFTLLAIRAFTQAAEITVVAKHDRQRELAAVFGATDVVAPDRAVKALRRSSQAFLLHPERGSDYLLGGADVAFEATGASGGLNLALRTVRAGGRVVLAGLPTARADLTPVWFRELELVGAYATGGTSGHAHTPEHEPAATTGEAPGRGSDFAAAMTLAAEAPLEGVVSATYPLQRWREAIDHAFAAGRLGALKIAFAPQEE
ncbi:MAG TPA: alcohol dehydrogenase catalytic domain-containing protein [Egibacteraceae bacterium]|nr:alcohol dehydrogenase catalytic domain-containing protein [Egibacteraceae bacterium]